MPTDQVMAVLPRAQAQALCLLPAHANPETLEAARESLRSALSQEVEERREYQAVYDENGTTWRCGGAVEDRGRADRRKALEERRRPTASNFRIRSRTTYHYEDGSQFVTAWSDLEVES